MWIVEWKPRPTEPGFFSHSWLSITVAPAFSVPPYISSRIGPHQSIICRLTSAGQGAAEWMASSREETS
jgi:hypothetical protein